MSNQNINANDVNGTPSAECGRGVASGMPPIGQVGAGRYHETGPVGSGYQAPADNNATGQSYKEMVLKDPSQIAEQNNGTKPKRRYNQQLTFDEIFTRKPHTRFFSIKSTNETDITKLNMIKVDKTITHLIGKCEKITEDFPNKSLTVETRK